MIPRPGTRWTCADFPAQTFYLWLVHTDTGFLVCDGTPRTHVSVPVSSFGSRWSEVRP